MTDEKKLPDLIPYLKSRMLRARDERDHLSARVFGEAIDELKRLQAELAKSPWIPVEEPPKASGKYLVIMEHRAVKGAFFPSVVSYITVDSMWGTSNRITHWMEIPDFPEAKQKINSKNPK